MGKSIKTKRNGVMLLGLTVLLVLAVSCSSARETPATQNTPVQSQETPLSQNKTGTIPAPAEPPQAVVSTPVPETKIITTPIPVPAPVPVPVSPVVPVPTLPTITPPIVKEDAALKNPTWNELKDFLLSDNTDKRFYVYPSFTSENYAEMLQNNAKKSGWRCAIVRIHLDWLDRQTGAHVNGVYFLNAFETTDQGIVYIDSTNPSVDPGGDYPGGFTGNAESVAKLEIGNNFNATFIFPEPYGGELVPDSMGVITGIEPLAW